MSKHNRTVDRIQAIWNMIGGDDVVDSLLAGRLEMDIKVRQLFTELTTTSFNIGDHKPRSFFQEREGLSMSPGFLELVQMTSADEDLEIVGTSGELGYTDALREVKESEVMAQFSELCVFDGLDNFLIILANLISAQWNGEKGPLKVGINYFLVKEKGEIHRIWVQCQHPRYKRWRCVKVDSIDLHEGHRFFSSVFY